MYTNFSTILNDHKFFSKCVNNGRKRSHSIAHSISTKFRDAGFYDSLVEKFDRQVDIHTRLIERFHANFLERKIFSYSIDSKKNFWLDFLGLYIPIRPFCFPPDVFSLIAIF